MQDENCVQCQKLDLASLNEQVFVDAVPKRADELKALGHKSLPHFSPNHHFFLFHSRLRRSIVCIVLYTVQQVSSLVTLQGTPAKQILLPGGS